MNIKPWVVATLAVVILILAGVVVYLVWWQPEQASNGKPAPVVSFDTCVAAGNPVMESHPRQCRDSESGVTYTEKVDQEEQPELTTQTYKSAKGVTITIDNWADNRLVSSPLTITGAVPGSWSFEGSFPIDLLFEGDIGLPGATAQLKGDWMTDEMVPFTASLVFDDQLIGEEVLIILRKDNPSGLPENDDSLRLKVRVED